MNSLPTPLEILLDPISLAIIAMFVILYLWETFQPRMKLPKVKYATLRSLISFAVFFYLSSYLPIFIDAYLIQFQLIDLSGIGTWQGAAIGLVLYQFGLYIWHWSMHKSDFLWRVFHQMHHSAEKLDVPSAFYFSPMDMIGFTILGSLCFALIVGLPAQSITVILLATNFLSIFQHANIHTPKWVGYFIQRPEMHAVHHAKGVHMYNYSDFSFIDMIFGTYKNPDTYLGETGFYIGGSAKVKEMLLFQDINDNKFTRKSA